MQQLQLCGMMPLMRCFFESGLVMECLGPVTQDSVISDFSMDTELYQECGLSSIVE